MTVLDWISALVGLTATKVSETVTSEAIKLWLADKKSYPIKKNLLSLYEEIAVLEYSSIKFLELLNDFNFFHQGRNEEDKISVDFRWQYGWGMLLTRQAKEVSEHMQAVSKIIRELNPRIEIYLPDLYEFMKVYEVYNYGELSLSKSLIDKYRDEFANITIQEFQEIAPMIKDAIEKLGVTKNKLAEFIKGEFSIKEL